MRFKALALTFLATIMVCELAFPSPRADAQTLAPGNNDRLAHRFDRLPLTFEKNQGQSQAPVKFLSRGKGYTAFLTAEGMVLSLRPANGTTSPIPHSAPAAKSSKPSNVTLQFKLVGAAANPTAVGEEPQPGRINYFIGNDPRKWHTNVATYARVRYRNVYPGIDLVYYGNHRQLEYDFAVAPGADAKQIQFEIKGAKKVGIDSKGDLILNTGAGELHFQSPVVYQESNGARIPVQGGYVMADSTHVGFRLTALDPAKPTVIDPALVYATYLGGSGDDQPTGIAVDGSGSVYVSGFTDSADFPLATLGSFASGSTHAFVAKFDPTGSNLVYADYLGGSNQDFGYALALNSSNEAYLTGSTDSSDFPVVNAYQKTYPGGSLNAFLARISADGSTLRYSTYFGGTGSDAPAGIAIDTLSDAVIAGSTSSTDLPVANAYQSTVSPNGGGVWGNYGFVTKFTPDGSQLIYSTYLGGASNKGYDCGGTPCWPSPANAVTGLALDSSGNAYVAGDTNTYDFPTTGGAYLNTDTTAANGIVGFVTKFDGSGTLQYSTYFYESSGIFTTVNGVAADALGSAYITGLAFSDGTFPVTSTAICDPGVYLDACGYAYVTKFDATGSTLLYSTFLGPNNSASPVAIVLDAYHDAYVLATSSSSSFGPVNGIEGYTGGSDALIAEIDPTAGSELFATFLGGSNDENASAMALDSNGNIYVTGTTGSGDFPITQASFQQIPGGNTDAFISKIEPASAAAVSATPFRLQFSEASLGTTTTAQTVLLRNVGSAALNISSIAGTANFAETDNCGSTLAAASSCTLSATFTPIAVGSLTGSITISDDAAGSPHVISLSGIGLGAIAALTPATLTFPGIQVGSTGAGQTVTLTNQGNADLGFSNAAIAGDYSQTNNCTGTLAASASCTFNLKFTPTATGIRTGVLTVTDSASGSPHTVALTGTGLGVVVSLTPTSLAFSGTPVGTTSAAQSLTVTNPGAGSLSISNIAATGDFSQTNNCTGTVAAGAGCTISVKFAPATSGSRTGALTVTDSGAGSPQTATLTGTGANFSIKSSSTSNTVKAGATATYSLAVAGVGGAFSGAVSLACTGAPAKTTCTASPGSVTPGSNSSAVTVTISTTGTTAEAKPLFPGRQQQPMYAVWMQLQGFGLFGMLLAGSKRRKKKTTILILLSVLVVGLLVMSACAGGTGIGKQSQTGTTPGTYPVTVTGTSGSLQHSLPLTLIVQ